MGGGRRRGTPARRCSGKPAPPEDFGCGADLFGTITLTQPRGIFSLPCIGGRLVYIGMPSGPVAIDIVAAQTKEITIETIFRYAHVFPRALALMGSGKIDLKPLITDVYAFEDSLKAFEYALHMGPANVKVMITLPESH